MKGVVETAHLRTHAVSAYLRPMRRRLIPSDTRRRIGGFLGGYFISAFVISLAQVNYWRHIAPPSPNSALGQIYEHNEHGLFRYFDAFQATSSYLLSWTNWFTVLFAIAFMPKRNTSVTRLGRLPIGVSWKTDDESGIAKKNTVVGAVIAPIVIYLLGPLLVRWLNSHGIVLSL